MDVKLVNLGMIIMTIFIIVVIHSMIQGKILMTMIVIMTICILFILVTSQGMIMMTMMFS